VTRSKLLRLCSPCCQSLPQAQYQRLLKHDAVRLVRNCTNISIVCRDNRALSSDLADGRTYHCLLRSRRNHAALPRNPLFALTVKSRVKTLQAPRVCARRLRVTVDSVRRGKHHDETEVWINANATPSRNRQAANNDCEEWRVENRRTFSRLISSNSACSLAKLTSDALPVPPVAFSELSGDVGEHV
jgi:hypothetical protein